MVHKGQEIEKAIRQSGYSITEIARRLHVSRRHLYNIFKMENPDPSFVIQLGKILHTSFSSEPFFQEHFSPNTQDPTISYSKENEPLIKEINYWKQKYILLLEEYNKLLKSK